MRIASIFAAVALVGSASAQPTFRRPDRIRYDGQCFTIDGHDTFLYSGAFHYFRCPKALWRDRFRKIKEAGFNAVETYVAWNWSERQRPRGLKDASKIDLTDLDEWLTMAEKEFGLYTIVRPGPYICSEWATGGFPNWLITFKPPKTSRADWFRSDDPAFVAWSRHWFDAVAKVVGKHQLTQKPAGSHGVILWQVENEYDYSSQPDDAKRNYVRELIDISKKDGIEVPIFTCWTSAVRYPKGDPVLSQAYDNPNTYPRWNVESIAGTLKAQHDAEPWAPKMVTEFQGGWFGQVGGLAAEEQDGVDDRQINALTLLAIQNGLTGLNYYMLFGGTNFGDWAGEGITTSYDYFAPIREWGGGGAKFRVVKAIGQMLERYGPELARTVETTSPLASDKPNVAVAARRIDNGAVYLFVRNTDRNDAVTGMLGGSLPYSLGPFGMNVYRYNGDPASGKWLVHPESPAAETLPAPIRLFGAEVATATPVGWKPAPSDATAAQLGVYDSRFLFYRATVGNGKDRLLWLQSTGGTLLTDAKQTPTAAQGGLAYAIAPSHDLHFVFLNPGWPNGGSGMEAKRGVDDVLLTSGLPSGTAVSNWQSHRLADGEKGTDFVMPDVETIGWADGADPSVFQPHTTVVIRSPVVMGAVDPHALLTSDGVDDEGWFYVNGHFVGEVHHWGVPVKFLAGPYLHTGQNVVAIVIHNIEGAGGLTGSVAIEPPLPRGAALGWYWTDKVDVGKYTGYSLDSRKVLERNVHPKVDESNRHPASLQVCSRVAFERPTGAEAWEILLDAGGDGFLTLNGEPLGRFWEVGPQRGYYLPPSMLREHNVLELCVVPGKLGDRIRAAELRPLPMKG